MVVHGSSNNEKKNKDRSNSHNGKNTNKNNKNNNKSNKSDDSNKSLSFELDFLNPTTANTVPSFDMNHDHDHDHDGEAHHGDDNSSGSNSRSTCCSLSSLLSKLRSIRSLTLLILIFLFFAMMGLFLAVLLSIFLTSFFNLEKSVVTESNKRLTRVLYEDLHGQLRAASDYSEWVDTCQAVSDLNRVMVESGGANTSSAVMDSYLEYNFYEEYIQSFHRMNFFAFYNTSGHLLTYLGYDLNDMSTLELPEELAYIPPSHPLFVTTDDTVGTVVNGGYMLTESPLLNSTLLRVTSSAIYFDPDYPEAVGFMIYAKYVDLEEVKRMSTSVQMCLSVYTSDQFASEPSVSSVMSKRTLDRARGTPPDVFHSEWTHDRPLKVSPFSASNERYLRGRECWRENEDGSKKTSAPRIASYQVYRDIFGENAILIRADVERYINTLGVKSFLWSYGIVCLIVIIISIVIVLFIELVVVGPVIQLSNSVHKIRKANDIKSRVTVPKSGTEISSLAKSVNSMLRALDRSQEKLASDHALLIRLLEKVAVEEQKSRAVMNAMSDFILTINAETGIIISANKSFYSKLGYSAPVVENTMHISALLKEWEHDAVLEQLTNLAETNGKIETDVHTSFSTVPVEVDCHTVKLFLDEKVIDCFVVVLRSMKERQELIQQLNKRQEQLLQLADQVKFDQMMRNHEERHKFHEFCKLENSEENFLFLEAIEKYRSLRSVHERALFQHEIVEKFLKETGSHPLNLSGKVLQSELLLIEKSCGDMSAFDKLETEVRVMTITDTFIRFNSSPRSLHRSE